jgi:tetratricopeptide (TPR) repeat protein
VAKEWLDGGRNRWEIGKILGGGMGRVYIVYDHELREPFAAKTFQDELFRRNPMVAERFAQEALAWTRLDRHANIAQARWVENIEGKPFLFLEYVSGGDLSDWIGTPRLSEDLPQVLRFAIQFCDGMSHALSKGIQAHRDIKPANCLITEDYTLKVTDFGLAKVFDEARPLGGADRAVAAGSVQGLAARCRLRWRELLGREVKGGNVPGLSIGATRTGTAAGTPPYMAPEQFDDAKHVDVRADVYSFGVMLYELLAGRLPLQGRTWQEFERLHKTQPPPPLVGCHSSLVTVVQTCLVKDPAARYANFDVLRGRLAEMYESLTGEAAPQPRTGIELNAVDYNNKGVSLDSLGRHAEALTCYERALEINPRYANAWSNKGGALDRLGRLAEALTCYDRAVEINPSFAEAWYKKGIALRYLGQHADVPTCFERVLETNPRFAMAWDDKGNALAHLGRHAEALTCYERALEISPRLPLTWYNKGVALADLGRPAEALTCYERALEINSRLEDAWSNKGNALVDLGRPAEALTCYERALEINPRLAEGWYNKGVALADLGRPAEALTCYDRALEINPRHPEAWYNKGVALARLGRLAEALTCFERALEINPRYAKAWYNKGVALAYLGRPAEALACYERALEINPRYPEAWSNKGVALADLGRPAEALTCYQRALEINPRFGDAWFNKGAVLHNAGRFQEALACLERAQQLGHPQAAEGIAACRRKLRR